MDFALAIAGAILWSAGRFESAFWLFLFALVISLYGILQRALGRIADFQVPVSIKVALSMTLVLATWSMARLAGLR